jgi:Tfp pilus assembly protein PilN
VILTPARLGIVISGERLIAAVVRGERVDTFVVEAEQPATALRAELDTRKLRVRRVALGLLRSAVTVKPIDLPTVDGVVRDMVQFELERHVPFPADDAPFDFVSLPAAPDGEGTQARRVLVTAAERRIVESALRIADEARLRPVSVTVAAHDLLGLVQLDRTRNVVWAHGDGTGTDLLFVTGRSLVLSRLVSTTDGARLADEIGRSLAVLRWRACDAVWVSGDLSSASMASPLAALDAPVSAPPYTPRARRLLAACEQTAAGATELALAVATGRRNRRLDLIPAARRPRRLTRLQGFTIASATATAALAIAALVYPGYRNARYLEIVNASIAQATPEVRATERVQQELERKRRLLSTVESVGTSMVRPLPILRELTELLPTDAWITQLSFDAKGLELTGQASAASALIPVLENSPRLERVEFASPVTRGRDKEQFRIRAAWEAGAATNTAAPAAAAPPPATAATRPTPPAAVESPPARPGFVPATPPARSRPTAADSDDEEETPPQPRRPVAPVRPAPGTPR